MTSADRPFCIPVVEESGFRKKTLWARSTWMNRDTTISRMNKVSSRTKPCIRDRLLCLIYTCTDNLWYISSRKINVHFTYMYLHVSQENDRWTKWQAKGCNFLRTQRARWSLTSCVSHSSLLPRTRLPIVMWKYVLPLDQFEILVNGWVARMSCTSM